jgi:GNAT superfamily N-acetyltransferase
MYNNSSGRQELFNLSIEAVPLNERTIVQLIDLWSLMFDADYQYFSSILAGVECEYNRDIIYFALIDGQIVGTCHLTISLANSLLGGLGEVCTLPQFRGKSIASTLCSRALKDFCYEGGRALFLGTSNPVAALIYKRLGWKKVPGTNVMLYVTNDESPEEFLSGYLTEATPVRIKDGTPADRIPIIPLIVAPHNWQVMDNNTNIFSSKFEQQNSCMGLFPRYSSLADNGLGTWFSAWNNLNQIVGLSTVRRTGADRFQIDGFTDSKFSGSWESLINAANSWAVKKNAHLLWSKVAVMDEEKISMFENCGFIKKWKNVTFNLNGRELLAVCLELKV